MVNSDNAYSIAENRELLLKKVVILFTKITFRYIIMAIVRNVL